METLTLVLLDIPLEKTVAALNSKKKGSSLPQVKITNKLVVMLISFVVSKKTQGKLRPVLRQIIAKNINKLKKRLVTKLGNLNLKKITLYISHHRKATVKYQAIKHS